MRKIVIPTDYSSSAYNALQFAVHLFKYEKCKFHLLHAFADEVYTNVEVLTPTQLKEVKSDLQAKHENKLEDLLMKIKEFSPNPLHDFQFTAVFGLLVDEINEVVNQENVDLVIMGTRGKTNNNQLSFGSNTLQVIKYIQSPVLIIPVDYTFQEISNILFPSNFMIPYQSRELKLLAGIGKSSKADIHMLYISNFPLDSLRQKENKEFISDQLREVTIQYQRVEEQERIATIMEQIDQLNIDLLVMVNSRYTYLENIIYESTVDKISLQPKIPFLVLQNYNRESR